MTLDWQYVEVFVSSYRQFHPKSLPEFCGEQTATERAFLLLDPDRDGKISKQVLVIDKKTTMEILCGFRERAYMHICIYVFQVKTVNTSYIQS